VESIAYAHDSDLYISPAIRKVKCSCHLLSKVKLSAGNTYNLPVSVCMRSLAMVRGT